MGKRIALEMQVPANLKSKRTRKRKAVKALDFNSKQTATEDETDRSFIRNPLLTSPSSPQRSGIFVEKSKNACNQSNKHANNSSIIHKQTPTSAAIIKSNALFITPTTNIANAHDVSQHTESPKPVYSLRPSIVNGTILKDLKKKLWRLGPPIGKGNFGEIFLASDDIGSPVTNENAKFVVKIEPHSNGPLFVEIHCLINTAKSLRNFNENNSAPIFGIPIYIASGSHYFGDGRYRFLVLPRFDCDLHSLIKNYRVRESCVLTLGLHILNTLEVLHNHGYCHNDIKAQNLMITKYIPSTTGQYNNKTNNKNNGNSNKNRVKCDYEEKQHTTDSGNSSDQEEVEDDDEAEGDDDDEDEILNSITTANAKKRLRQRKGVNYILNYDNFIDNMDDETTNTTTTNSNDSNIFDDCNTPLNRMATNGRRRRNATTVQFQGSNPMRSCRKDQGKNNSIIYDEMVKSHYLRPRGRISYSEFFNDDGATGSSSGGSASTAGDCYFKPTNSRNGHSTDEDCDEFLPNSSSRRSSATVSKSYAIKAHNNYKADTKNTKNSCVRRTRRQEKLLQKSTKKEYEQNIERNFFNSTNNNYDIFRKNVKDQIYLIDFGLASKFMDNGVHRPFVMDQRRAHDGTLEFTSRDAHLGAHSRRSDLECLGYNLLFWSQGYLPWREAARQHQQEQVHRAKEYLMTDVRTILKLMYEDEVPSFIGEFLHMIGQLGYQERPDYERYRKLFKSAYRRQATNGTKNCEMTLCREDIRKNCIRIDRINQKILQDHHTPLINSNYKHLLENGFTPNNQENTNNMITPVTPIHGRLSTTNRVSPKNLRSKSAKKSATTSITKTNDVKDNNNFTNVFTTQTQVKQLSWSDILSHNPDEIARCRAEMEFEREEKLLAKSMITKPKVRQYQGKPTYAILDMLRKRGMEIPSMKLELKVKRESNDNTWRLATNHKSHF